MPCVPLHLIFNTGFLIEPELIWLAWLASELPRIPLPQPFSAGTIGKLSHTWLSMWEPGMYFCMEHFKNEPILKVGKWSLRMT